MTHLCIMIMRAIVMVMVYTLLFTAALILILTIYVMTCIKSIASMKMNTVIVWRALINGSWNFFNCLEIILFCFWTVKLRGLCGISKVIDGFSAKQVEASAISPVPDSGSSWQDER